MKWGKRDDGCEEERGKRGVTYIESTERQKRSGLSEKKTK